MPTNQQNQALLITRMDSPLRYTNFLRVLKVADHLLLVNIYQSRAIAKEVYPHLLANGRIIRPWIGISGKLIRAADLSRLFNLPLVDGFLIEAVEPGSPAEKETSPEKV